MLDELEGSNQIETTLRKKSPSRSMIYGQEEGPAKRELGEVYRKQTSVNYKRKKSAGLVAGGRQLPKEVGYESLFNGVRRQDSVDAEKVACDSRQLAPDSSPVFAHPAGGNPRFSPQQVFRRNSFGPAIAINGGQSRNPYQNLNNKVISYLATSNAHLGQLTAPRKGSENAKNSLQRLSQGSLHSLVDPNKKNQLLKSRIGLAGPLGKRILSNSGVRNESVRNNRNLSRENLDLPSDRRRVSQKGLRMPQKRKSVTSDRVIESVKLAKGADTVGYRKSITRHDKKFVIEEVCSDTDGME